MLALKQIMEENDKKAKFLAKNYFFNNIPIYKIDPKYEINEPPILDESQIDKEYDLRHDIIEKILSAKCEDNTKIFKVRFRKRASGYQPRDAELNIDEIKKWAPVTLVDFYESKLHNFKNNNDNADNYDSPSDVDMDSDHGENSSESEEDEKSG